MAITEGQMTTGAHAVIAGLEALGVDRIFGYPGGQVLDIFDALHDSQKISCLLMRHEQAATHAADGYARATGRPGVVLVTSGPGATNTVTGIATAYMDSVPLVVITGQVPTGVIGTDAFQESDITGITLPIVKHSYLVKDVTDLPNIIKEAFYIATTGRKGPVLIDIPSNIAKATFAYHCPSGPVQLPTYKPTYKGHVRQIKQAASLIEHASRPVLYVGGGIIGSGAEDKLLALAEHMEIPVVATLMGKGCFPEDHRLSLGMPGMHGMRYSNLALAHCDLLIAVGVRFTQRVTGDISEFADAAKVIHIDIDPAEIGKNRLADVPIVGDAGNVLGAIDAELVADGAKPRSEEWLAQVFAWRDEFALPHQDADGSPDGLIHPSLLLDTLDGILARKDYIVTTEVGQHQMWASQYLMARKPRSFLTSGGLGTMGFGFPAAIGAQIAFPDKLVVCIAGDGSIQMNSQEMATAAINGLPVKVVIMDNRCLGEVRQFQQVFYNERYQSTILAPCPDFVKLADAYGWTGVRIDSPQSLGDKLESALATPGPVMIDVAIPMCDLALPMMMPDTSVDDEICEVPQPGPIDQKGE